MTSKKETRERLLKITENGDLIFEDDVMLKNVMEGLSRFVDGSIHSENQKERQFNFICGNPPIESNNAICWRTKKFQVED